MFLEEDMKQSNIIYLIAQKMPILSNMIFMKIKVCNYESYHDN